MLKRGKEPGNANWMHYTVVACTGCNSHCSLVLGGHCNNLGVNEVRSFSLVCLH